MKIQIFYPSISAVPVSVPITISLDTPQASCIGVTNSLLAFLAATHTSYTLSKPTFPGRPPHHLLPFIQPQILRHFTYKLGSLLLLLCLLSWQKTLVFLPSRVLTFCPSYNQKRKKRYWLLRGYFEKESIVPNISPSSKRVFCGSMWPCQAWQIMFCHKTWKP